MTKEEILTDALDHIAKVAGMARTLTKRLDWIVARAKTAIQGDEWDNSYKPMPSNSLQRVERLRFQVEELREQLRTARAEERERCIARADQARLSLSVRYQDNLALKCSEMDGNMDWARLEGAVRVVDSIRALGDAE